MTDVMRTLQLKGKEYPLVFNLNVMEAIQEEYGTLDQWGKLTDGTDGEPNAKAVIFGFREMINEGLDIKAEESGEEYKPITLKQCGIGYKIAPTSNGGRYAIDGSIGKA